MFLNKKNISQNQLLNFLFCLIPVSLIIGSLVVNLNILLLIIVSFFDIKKINITLLSIIQISF